MIVSQLRPWMFATFLPLAVAGTQGVAGERATLNDAVGESVTALVERLGHADFAAREAASRALVKSGVEAIPQIAEAALSPSPETATRALSVLEEHLRSDDATRFEPADDALEQLSGSDRSTVALEATEILSRHRTLREQRALVAIRALGGGVRFDTVKTTESQWMVGGGIVSGAGRGLRPSEIVIGDGWTGGTEGLKYLRRLQHRHNMKLYVVRSSGVPLAEAQALAAVLPDLQVQERGPYLGISSAVTFDTGPCVVGEVQAEGPARRAGIRAHDIISAVNGREVSGFEDLIEKLKDHAVGERVSMTIGRRNAHSEQAETINLNVELGKWELPEYTDDALEYLRDQELRDARNRTLFDDEPEPSLPEQFNPAYER